MDSNLSLFQYRVVHVNIRGIKSNQRNLEHYLAEHCFPEVVTLNETMLRSDKNININGYYCAARREPTGMSGKHSSMILVKNCVQDVVELEFLRTQFTDEVIGIEILRKDSRPGLNIVTYYNSPGNKVNPGIFCRSLYSKNSTIITGDLNCKHLAWGSSITDPQGTHLSNTLEDQDWIVLNDGSKTRIDPRSGKEEVLDLMVCTPDSLNMKPEFFIGDCVGSDHLPMHCIFTFGEPHSKNPIYTRKVSQMDSTRFKEILDSNIGLLPENYETAEELDTVADLLPEVIREAYESSCPLRELQKKRKPVTPHILALIKEKRRLRRGKCDACNANDPVLVQSIQKEMNRVGNLIKKEQRLEQKRRLEISCQRLSREKDPRKFFQSVKKLTGTGEANTARTRRIKDELGNIACTARERVELFANRLGRVHQTPEFVGFDDGWKKSVERFINQNDRAFKTDPISKYLEPEEGDNSPLVEPPTMDEVADHMKNCKTNSAAGPDGIGYDLLKQVPSSFLAYITKFYGACIRLGYFPKAWKHAKTTMVPKPGKDLSSAKNYRPISLLSCIGKLFERLLAGRISKY